MNAKQSKFVLTFQCPDRPGIVADVTSLFAGLGFTIDESSQHRNPGTNRFFMRTVYSRVGDGFVALEFLRAEFGPLALRYEMQWQLHTAGERMRVLVAVSRLGHCLSLLLNASRNRNMPVDMVGVVSNHEDLRDFTQWYGVPFHYLPVGSENRAEQEAALLDILDDSGAQLLVLARYMQILSDETCERLVGRAINIHHSFLPGFKGAKPYAQAYARGVKLVGATAHYVTAELDEGPIVEQDVMRVHHGQTARELAEIGRDLEAVVLNRAVKWHAEHRVLLDGGKTVVFDR